MESLLTLMESSWLARVKSLAQAALRRSDLDLILHYADQIVIVAYLIFHYVTASRSSISVSLAVFLLLIIDNSYLFDLMSEWQLHTLKAGICFLIIHYVVESKAKIAVIGLAALNIGMVLDALANPTTETFLWRNYEIFTLAIHALIIASFDGWGEIRARVEHFANRLVLQCRALGYYFANL